MEGDNLFCFRIQLVTEEEEGVAKTVWLELLCLEVQKMQVIFKIEMGAAARLYLLSRIQ